MDADGVRTCDPDAQTTPLLEKYEPFKDIIHFFKFQFNCVTEV